MVEIILRCVVLVCMLVMTIAMTINALMSSIECKKRFKEIEKNIEFAEEEHKLHQRLINIQIEEVKNSKIQKERK